MKLIDLHADTITRLYCDPDNYIPAQEFVLAKPFNHLAQNNLHIDLNKLRKADSLAQFFVLWLNLKNCLKYEVSPWDHFVKLYTEARQQLAINQAQIELVMNVSELDAAAKAGKLASFLCVEEGGFITDLTQLDQVYQMGIRYITIVWNYETHIGVPGSVDHSRGLKPFGIDMVMKMQELGILVDVSHLSDQGVSDILSFVKKPIIASHSNARALCSHRRNLPDELIRGIADNGGVVGISCVPGFLADNEPTIKIANMVAHIRHIYNLAGEDVLAIGNDFDGFRGNTPHLDEIKSIADLPKLATALVADGFSERQVEKFFALNTLRILKNFL